MKFSLATAILSGLSLTANAYKIGTGIHDMTGPAAQVNFMGYAAPAQIGHGIHTRLRARSYIVTSDDDKDRVAFVSMDAGMGSDILNIRVLPRLAELLGDDSLYTIENVAISGTHSHSGPAGFLQYILYQFTSLGYVAETTDTFVESVAQSLFKAHKNLVPGEIMINESGDDFLTEANINRSPSSYLLNPQAERDEHSAQGDTDKNMMLLKFVDNDQNELGMLNWFAVHGTNMNNTNKLISGDNKGYAAYLFEKEMNNNALPGTGKFVGAFASTNLGDVSPNTNGAKCIDTGLPCDFDSSTCDGKNENCIAFGPGVDSEGRSDMFESTKIIGSKQFVHAKGLYDKATTKLSGPIRFTHSFLDMTFRPVTLEDGTEVTTCPAALGYAFAAGTTDGPGMFNFVQGENTTNPFWNVVSGFLSKPTQQEIDCQHPKPILLNTGDCKKPYDWDPTTVPISVFQIGQLFVVNAPGEFTTMAGRRIRKTIKDLAISNGVENPMVTIAGLTNTYTHYITTNEEYAGQRYEAASTLYGPHTLSAYIQEYTRIVKDLFAGVKSETDAAPVDLADDQIELVPPVIADFVGIGHDFGDVEEDANDSYTSKDKVSVTFLSANPRNNQRIEDTFLTVELKNEDGSFSKKYVDGDWCTKFMWKGGVGHAGRSTTTVEWDINEVADLVEGTYRICHFGVSKNMVLANKDFSGCSKEFSVTA